MTLNAQERAAVEAAMSRAHSEESGPYRRIIARVPWPTDAVYALGHLSGFRAGVAAALQEAAKSDSALDATRRIRALAQAQENEHGS